MKKLPILLGLVMFLALGVIVGGGNAKAASATINFTTSNAQPKVGEAFVIVSQVSSSDTFLDVDYYVSYDSSVMEFIEGGKKVTGKNGLLHIKSTGNTKKVTKKTFSLQFKAIKAAGTAVKISESASVKTATESLSVSSNQLSVVVLSASDAATTETTPVEKKSDNNKLANLKIKALTFAPKFQSKVTQYTGSVDFSTTTLFYSLATDSKKAKASVLSNEQLRIGVNHIVVEVTAESGKVKKYNLIITRESKEQTTARLKKIAAAKPSPAVTFQVSKKDDKIILKNSYEFVVKEVANGGLIPAGYEESVIQIDGIEVPAYTMTSDLDNNYLLLYLQEASGKSQIYQFDRQEKTIQRYTGDMIKKVNKDGNNKYVTQNSTSQIKVESNTLLYGVIVILVLVVLLMLTVMLKLIAKKKRSDRSYDELDF